MWPLLLALIESASSDQAKTNEASDQQSTDLTYNKKIYDQNEFKKKNANSEIDQQRRAALARALKTQDNELPKQLNSEMYPEIKKDKTYPSNWRSVAGAAQAAQGINWNKLFGDYSGANSALNPGSDSPASYAGPDSGSYSDIG